MPREHPTGAVHRPYELAFDGPADGNPFVDVDLSVEFTGPSGATVRVGGFYDGDGTYRARVLPGEAGAWTFRSSFGPSGSFEVVPSARPGPVRADGFHFRHADGSRHTPFGTTAYAWTHQPDALQERTLATLRASPFNKLRMCVLPKWYDHNHDEPERFPFPRNGSGWDTTRFDVAFFQHLERRVADLDAIGVQADVILFHPYDHWGFADLGAEVDERYLRYVVRRLAAHPNVWWAMANEYDLLPVKDWERLAAVVAAEDHAGHLRSIHNCVPFYDHTRPWITHASVQRVDVYKTAEHTDTWRREWGKPVVIDECGYEGDLEWAWGNLTAPELVRRCWEGAVRGGYVQHGETYWSPDEVIWWAKGGPLRGESAERIRFLAGVVAAAPDGVLDPLPSDWDVPSGGVEDRYVVVYLGAGRPRARVLSLRPGVRWRVEVLDTWACTVEPLDGVFSGSFPAPLPARPYLALRLVAEAR